MKAVYGFFKSIRLADLARFFSSAGFLVPAAVGLAMTFVQKNGRGEA